MKKQDVIDEIGSQTEVAELLGIKQPSVANWPEILPPRISDRVIGAMHRMGLDIPQSWLANSEKE